MPLEFALRPRIKIAEGFAPPRRSRWRVPRLALPIVAYWLTAGGITYALIHAHEQPIAAQLAPVAPPAEQPWWPQPMARATSVGFEAAPTGPASAALVAPEPSSTSEEVSAIGDPALDEPRPVTPSIDADDPETSRVLPAVRRNHEVSDDEVEVAPREVPAAAAIPSLAPAPTREAPPLLGATPPDAPVAVANALPSCEAATAAANQELDLARRDRAPDLSREAIASVLDNGVWIARCDIPMTTAVDLCVAIRAGKAIGVSVVSRPASAGINACVKRRAASLSFPYSDHVDVARTHF